MQINISLDNLDEAISQLNDLAKRLEEFPEDLANDVATDITSYAKSVESVGGNTSITATRDGIAFLEYGAGFYADRRMIGDIPSEPGAWSKDHARTFQHYHGTIDGYRYNQKPRHEMERVIMNLQHNTEAKAGEYFR